MCGQDALFSLIFVTIITLFFSISYILLINRMGNKNIYCFSKIVMGKYFSYIFFSIVILYLIFTSGLIVREISELMVTNYMPETPMWFFNITIIFTAISFVFYGIEVVTRSMEVAFYLFLFSLLIVIFLAVPEMKLSNIYPVAFESEPIIDGLLPGLLFFSQVSFVLYFSHLIKNKKKLHKTVVIAVLVIGVLNLIVALSSIMLFDTPLAGSLQFQLLALTRYVEISKTLERFDAFFMFYWVGGGIFKIAIFVYSTDFFLRKLLSIRKLINMSYVFILVFFIANYYFKDILQVQNILSNTVFILIALSVQFIFPSVLLCVSLLRGINCSDI